MKCLRRKSISHLQREADVDLSLRRELSAMQLILLGVGCTIGAGIFVLTGKVAAENAGPAVILSFGLAGLAAVFAALCYSEFASLVPIAGSAYTYSYTTLGELFAWIIGWDLILEYAIGATTVAIGWSGYVVSFLSGLGIHIPPELSAARGVPVVLPDGSSVVALFNLPAAIIVGTLVAAFASVFTIGEAGNLCSIGTLLAFVIVCGSVLVLRIREPHHHRAFRTPAIWLTAPAGILSSGYLMISLPWSTWERLLVWLAIGLVIYFLYGVRRSRLNLEPHDS